MDVHTKRQRSYNMSRVHSKNTKPELVLFQKLKEAGLTFVKHYKSIGKPDVAFPKYKLAIFVDGEYWHGKGFNEWEDKLSDFWRKKISDNIRRDRSTRFQLKKSGWKVLRIWGRDVIKNPDKILEKILFHLKVLKID